MIFFTLIAAGLIGINGALPVHAEESRVISTPLDMESLKQSLSQVRSPEPSKGDWPRNLGYSMEIFDLKTDSFQQSARSFELKQRPQRIIPHAVGVTEILWAICPRERLIAFNDLAADPEFCIIADEVRRQGPVFQTKQTEIVIGHRPDLVFTVFYSDPAFIEKLAQAKIPTFDLGYFGTIESVKKQTLLIGSAIGEEGNAQALVKLMDEKMGELQRAIPDNSKPLRVLYYDEGGYIPGKSSNFDSICAMIKAVNVGTEQGIKSWRQIDYETLLLWNPDVIIVPEESNLQQMLLKSQMLSHGAAVKNKRIYNIPGVYLRVDSQFMILSANVLAGILYEKTRQNSMEQ
ncbi:MAG: ABC transporter substrate-binding protein [Desulfobacterales bacterium]|jgi:iron complex transport system substrate-binding protein|nr:ABC transporter substrate-binding protein [Desulfobacterales bacterium]